ncbi:MAG: roadblock/LC7 domain-containing protein [Actinobacteria bacterium]|nr:roadblock/LC7 domain-containing protein [Actinomycetota bacterium]
MTTRRGLIITDQQLESCDQLLWELKGLLNCTFLGLISTAGQPITSASSDYHPETFSLASLTASAFAATRQLATILDEREFTLLFHEGDAVNLHVAQVNDQVLLLITFGRDVPIGQVRLYTQRSIAVLQRILADHSGDDQQLIVDDAYEMSMEREMDQVFRDNGSE